MSSLPLYDNSPRDRPDAVRNAEFGARLRVLHARFTSLWRESSVTEPVPGDVRGVYGKWRTFRHARRLVASIGDQIEKLPPEGSEERREWRLRLEAEIRRFGSERLDWPAGYGHLLLADEFYESTIDFVREARAFDPDLEPGDIGQALRNVWIVNSIQMLLERPVVTTPSALAYSLLYPYTDNYLDDPEVDPFAKRAFVDLLDRRLAGGRIDASDERQENIFRLVGRIEEEFDRRSSPDVFSSLIAIHRAQVRSLRQQGGRQLSETELVEISVAKGGASVLADGYLAARSLEPEEAAFCFGYGVFLQLLDDLQDALADRAVGHETLFSRAARREPLDELVSRLYGFMVRVVSEAPGGRGRGLVERQDLILRNCTFLLVGAVAEQTELFRRGFLRRLQRRWPMSFRAMRKLGRESKQRFSDASRRLCDERGVGSLLDLI